MANFNTCSGWVLTNECGSVYGAPLNYATTKDNRGMVIAGINSTVFPVDFAEVNDLPESLRPPRVTVFYNKNFWNQWLTQLLLDSIGAYTMDCDVNQGPRPGVVDLQEAVQECGSQIKVDGLWGPNTVALVNTYSKETLLPAFQYVRAAAYKRIGGPCLDGWLARAAKTPPFP